MNPKRHWKKSMVNQVAAQQATTPKKSRTDLTGRLNMNNDKENSTPINVNPVEKPKNSNYFLEDDGPPLLISQVSAPFVPSVCRNMPPPELKIFDSDEDEFNGFIPKKISVLLRREKLIPKRFVVLLTRMKKNVNKPPIKRKKEMMKFCVIGCCDAFTQNPRVRGFQV